MSNLPVQPVSRMSAVDAMLNGIFGAITLFTDLPYNINLCRDSGGLIWAELESTDAVLKKAPARGLKRTGRGPTADDALWNLCDLGPTAYGTHADVLEAVRVQLIEVFVADVLFSYPKYDKSLFTGERVFRMTMEEACELDDDGEKFARKLAAEALVSAA